MPEKKSPKRSASPTGKSAPAATASSPTKSLPSFHLPSIADNPSGWGPCSVPEELSNIPYAPYSKADRLGKIADWTAPADGSYSSRQAAMDESGRRRARFGAAEAFGSGTASAFMYQHAAEEEASFSVVDRGGSALKKPAGFKTQRSRASNVGRQGRREAPMDRRGLVARGTYGGRKRYGYSDKPQRVRDSSVKVGPEWSVMEEMEFTRLNKLNYMVDEPEDIATYGDVLYADKAFDRISTKTEKSLHLYDKTFHNITTSEDPILQKMAISATTKTVFATDNVLAVLMCAPRSVYSWDIVILKDSNKVFLDKRDGGHFDLLSVNENAVDPPMDSADRENPNTPSALSLEATYINRNFSQQVLKEDEKCTFKMKNPFYDPSVDDIDPLASVAYRYRKWDLGDDISLVARTQLDAAVQQAGSSSSDIMSQAKSSFSPSETSFATIKALNEFDSKAAGAGGAPEWRQKLDSQRGAVMATEIKNNGNKLARWTVESILSGADQIRIGFVSRVNSRDRNRHSILGMTSFKPKEFASQMNLSMGNAWGILKTIVDICYKLDNGKYVLVKDPNKATLRLYQVPANTFEEEEEEEVEVEEDIE